MTKKKHEELVEDIPGELIERFVEMGYEPRRRYATVSDARRRAPAQIRLILSAVRDGRLKIPGEVARGIMESVMIGDKVVWRGADKRYRYIALRPLTGTGKEEE